MKHRNLLTLVLMVFFIGASACSTTGQSQADESTGSVQPVSNPMMDDQQDSAAQGGEKQQKMMQMCPMEVEGTTRQVVKLDDGVALDFTTTGDVEELRNRVQNMAQKHGEMHGEGGMMHGKGHGEGDMMGGEMHAKMTDEQRQMRQQMRQMMAGATVGTEQITDGMRMTFTPKDAAQTDELFQMMDEHSEMMGEQGQCPMM